ncbi:MAG: leucyl aminopeptidase [Actinomycetes bacterium]
MEHEPRSASARKPVGVSHGQSSSLAPDVVTSDASVVDADDVDVISVRTTQDDDAALPGPEVAALSARIGVDLAAYLTREQAKGSAGEVIALPLPGEPLRTVLMVGTGDGSAAALRKAGAALGRGVRDATSVATSLCADADAAGVRAFVEALLLATYTFTVKSQPKPLSLERVVVQTAHTAAVEQAITTASAVRLARDLANTPSLEKDPAWLAARATQVAKETGIEVSVREDRALVEEKFGGIVAVGAGSWHPPRLIELRWKPPGARTHVVLIGKGITFDSGGLSIKPADGMVAMKTDMAGGAAVIAAMSAVKALGVRARVTALVPAAENMPSGSAMRPGDVITHYGGTTVEVLNTDAEGRLVLADALAYADARLRPDVVVDLATLTGAASLGLGRIHGALYATDDALAGELVVAAHVGGEQIWRMPLVEDYRDALDSPVADLRNIGEPSTHYSGGSISAALFLREFTGGRRWAHLDIAGPARSDKDDGEISRGATGYGVRLLLRWLETLD